MTEKSGEGQPQVETASERQEKKEQGIKQLEEAIADLEQMHDDLKAISDTQVELTGSGEDKILVKYKDDLLGEKFITRMNALELVKNSLKGDLEEMKSLEA